MIKHSRVQGGSRKQVATQERLKEKPNQEARHKQDKAVDKNKEEAAEMRAQNRNMLPKDRDKPDSYCINCHLD